MVRIDIRRARIAYVSTIAARVIALPLCSAFLCDDAIPAAAHLPWEIAERRPERLR